MMKKPCKVWCHKWREINQLGWWHKPACVLKPDRQWWPHTKQTKTTWPQRTPPPRTTVGQTTKPGTLPCGSETMNFCTTPLRRALSMWTKETHHGRSFKGAWWTGRSVVTLGRLVTAWHGMILQSMRRRWKTWCKTSEKSPEGLAQAPLHFTPFGPTIAIWTKQTSTNPLSTSVALGRPSQVLWPRSITSDPTGKIKSMRLRCNAVMTCERQSLPLSRSPVGNGWMASPPSLTSCSVEQPATFPL